MKRSLLLTSIFTLLAAGIAVPAMAGTATSDLGVSATVTSTCTISTTSVNFGTYDPLASSILGATGIVSTTCTLGTPVQITLGQGLNPATGSTDAAPARQMKSSTNYLKYNLYQDTAGLIVWGNTVETSVSTLGTGLAVPTTVYGKITANQNVPAGTYSDTVIATVTY